MAVNDLEIILTRFNSWETEAEKEDYIDRLESMLTACNQAAAKEDGSELVPDSIYDTMMDYLRVVKPDSDLLLTVWSEDDPTVAFDEELDYFLVHYPMLSIQTVKHLSDKPIKDFMSKLPVGRVRVCATMKENGHGVRATWKDGYLVKATSRGRSTNGKDLTNQMRIILGEYNEALADLGLVEIRAEVLLPFSNLDEARKFNPSIKSAFSGVASMIRASASEQETALLHFVAYDILTEEQEFETLTEKLEFLQEAGFIVPAYGEFEVSRRTLEEDLEDILVEMDINTTDYDYFTDGIVVSINDIDLFNEFGAEDKFRYGNLALKIGRWSQDSYSGVVTRIEWMKGKSKKTPVAIIEGVITATGNTVTNVPLYAPVYILMLEAYPGNTIHFRYGGEAGVVPVTQDGRLVTDVEFSFDL